MIKFKKKDSPAPPSEESAAGLVKPSEVAGIVYNADGSEEPSNVTVDSQVVYETAGLTGETATAIRIFEQTYQEFAGTASDKEVAHYGYDGYSIGGIGYSMDVSTGMQRGSTLESIRERTIPKKKIDRIKRSFAWAEDDDLLFSIIDVKTDFSMMGLDFRCRPPEGNNIDLLLSRGKISDDSEESLSKEEINSIKEQQGFQRYLSSFCRKWDLEAIVRDLFVDWYTCDTMILYWKVESSSQVDIKGAEGSPEPDSKEALMPGLIQMYALPPNECRWENGDGSDMLYYTLPKQLHLRIAGALRIGNKEAKAEALRKLIEEDGVPPSWIISVSQGKTEVLLRREDGDNWIVVPKKRKQAGISDPSMSSVFPYLEIRKALKDGDYAAAYMMKHFILHVTLGESINGGPLEGQRTNWAKAADTKKMYDVITRTTKTARLVTNHTVKFSYIFPPKEMWDDAKYHKSELAIMNWGGVSLVVLSGNGSTNSSGYISTKRLIATMVYGRRRINYLFSEFFDHASIKSLMLTQPPLDSHVSTSFDENILKEPRQLLNEITSMLAEGLSDPRTATKELGRDPDTIRINKLQAMAENEKTDLYTPMNPPFAQDLRNRKGVGGQGAGRPPNEGTTPNEDTRTQPPVLK